MAGPAGREGLRKMIVDRSELDPVFASEEVELFPVGRDEAEGTLVADGRELLVRVRHEERRLALVRVQVIAETPGEFDDRAPAVVAIAERGLRDEAWAPLCMDPRDGETLYVAKLTCDVTSAAVDRALRAARGFVEEHGDEVRAIVGGPGREAGEGRASGGEPDIGFGLADLFGGGAA